MGCGYVVAEAVFAPSETWNKARVSASSALRGARPVVDLTRASSVPHRPYHHTASRFLFLASDKRSKLPQLREKLTYLPKRLRDFCVPFNLTS